MNVFAIGTVAAALAGLGMGYWSGGSGKATPSTIPAPAPAPVALSESRPIDPAWRPGLEAEIDKAETQDDFRSLLESIYDLQPDKAERDEWMRATVARWVDRHGVAAVRHLHDTQFWQGHRPDLLRKIYSLQKFALHRLATIDLVATLDFGRGMQAGVRPRSAG